MAIPSERLSGHGGRLVHFSSLPVRFRDRVDFFQGLKETYYVGGFFVVVVGGGLLVLVCLLCYVDFSV